MRSTQKEKESLNGVHRDFGRLRMRWMFFKIGSVSDIIRCEFVRCQGDFFCPFQLLTVLETVEPFYKCELHIMLRVRMAKFCF